MTPHFPHFISQTNPAPPDESDTTGQVFFQIRMIPTPPDEFDRMHPSFNPKVPGSRPGRPTKVTGPPKSYGPTEVLFWCPAVSHCIGGSNPPLTTHFMACYNSLT